MSTSNTVTFGALEFGVILAAFSNGGLVLQVNRYFDEPGRDQPLLKTAIFFIWLVTIGHFGFATWILYFVTITKHGEPTLSTPFPSSLPALASIGAVVHSSVQSIYTYRLYKFTGRWELPVVFWVLSAYTFASAVAYSVVEIRAFTSLAGLFRPDHWNWIFISHFSVAAGTDVLISISTCWCLIKTSSGTFKRTHRLIDQIMLRIVQTGVATSAISICTAITFAVSQPKSVWMGLYLPLIPLYPAALLALLNDRVSIKSSLSDLSPSGFSGTLMASRLDLAKGELVV